MMEMESYDSNSTLSTLQKLSILLFHHFHPNSNHQNGGNQIHPSTSAASLQLENLNTTLESRLDAILQAQHSIASLESFRSIFEIKVDQLCETSEMVWAGKGGIKVGKSNARQASSRGKRIKLNHHSHAQINGIESGLVQDPKHPVSNLGLGHPSSSTPNHPPQDHSKFTIEKRDPKPKLIPKHLESLKNKTENLSEIYEKAIEKFESDWQSSMRVFDRDLHLSNSTSSSTQASSSVNRAQAFGLSTRNEFLLVSIIKSIISKPQEIFQILLSQKGDSSLEELTKPISTSTIPPQNSSSSMNRTFNGDDSTELESGSEDFRSSNLLEIILKMLVCCDGDSKGKGRRVLDFTESVVVTLITNKQIEEEEQVSSRDDGEERKPTFSWIEIEKFLLTLMDTLQNLDLRIDVEEEEEEKEQFNSTEQLREAETEGEEWDPDPMSPSKDLELEIMTYLKEIRRFTNSNPQEASSNDVSGLSLSNHSSQVPTKIGPKRAISLSHSIRPSHLTNLNPARFFSSTSPPPSSTSSHFPSESGSGLSHLTLSNLGSNAAELWNYGMSGSVATLTGLGLGWRTSSSSNGKSKEDQVGDVSSIKSGESDEKSLSSIEISSPISSSTSTSTFASSVGSPGNSNPIRATSLLKGMGNKGGKSTKSKAMATASVTSVPPSLSVSRFVTRDSESSIDISTSKSPSTPRTRKVSLDDTRSNINSIGFPVSPSKVPISSSSNLADVQEDETMIENSLAGDEASQSAISVSSGFSNSNAHSSVFNHSISRAQDSLGEVAIKSGLSNLSPSPRTQRLRSISDVGRTSPTSTFSFNTVDLNPLTSKRRNRVESFGNGTTPKDDIKILRNQETIRPVDENEVRSTVRGKESKSKSEAEAEAQSPTKKAARRVLRSLLLIRNQDEEGSQHSIKRKLNSIPLTLALCRRLLLNHFPSNETSSNFKEKVHRRLILLFVIRWYSFTHLGKNLLLRPNRSGKCLGFDDINSVHFDQSRATTSNFKCKILNDVWIYDEKVGRELGELHKEIYESLLRVSGFGKESESGSSRGSGRSGLTNESLDRESRKLVGLFGVGIKSSSQIKKSKGSRQSPDDSSRGQVSVLKFNLQEIGAVVDFLRTVALKKHKENGDAKVEGQKQVANNHRPISQSDLDQLSRDLKHQIEKPFASSSDERNESLFISRSFKDGKYAIDSQFGRLQKELYLDRKSAMNHKKLVDDNGTPNLTSTNHHKREGTPIKSSKSSRSDSLQKAVLTSNSSSSSPINFVPFPTSSSTPQSASSYSSNIAPSTSSSSGFSISTVGHRRNGGSGSFNDTSGLMSSSFHSSNGSNVGWGSPPCSPSDEGNGIRVGNGEGFFDLQSGANHLNGNSNSFRSRRRGSYGEGKRSDSISESLSSNSVAFPSTNSHQRDGTLTNSAPLRNIRLHLFNSISQVAKVLEEAQIPINELRRGIFTLLRRFPVHSGSSNLRELLVHASTSSKKSHDYENHFLFERTLSWLDFVTSNYSSLAFGMVRDVRSSNFEMGQDSGRNPQFQPLLSYFLLPLTSNEEMIGALTLETQSKLSDLEVLRRGLIDIARSIFSRLFELRAKAWYASEVRIDPLVIESRTNAVNKLEEVLGQAVESKIVDEKEGEETAKQWLQRLGIYDFEVGTALEDYFKDLDGAFGVITGDANQFFSSPL